MNYPQSRLEVFAKNCCLFMCYVYCAGLEPDNLPSWFDYAKHAIANKVIDEDATVNNAEKLLFNLTGRRFNVQKVDISDLTDIKDPTPVKFYAPGYTPHWVVVENGKIVFDPYANSKSVKLGKPVSARVITLAGRE